tara:strand:+ start:12 stop:1121 length:1110 start_codon:yes stop_codon:yes gene_type:complete
MKINKNQIIIAVILLISTVIVVIYNYSKKVEAITVENIDKEVKSSITCLSKKVQDVIPLINFSGRVSAGNKINIFSEVSGKSEITNIQFEIGEEFNKNDILISINDDDLALELNSIKSEFLSLLLQAIPDIKIDFPSSFKDWKNYIDNYKIESSIGQLPNIHSTQQRNYISSRGIFSMYYSIRAIEEKLNKFIIRAPFKGVLTEALIDPGSNIIMGQKLGQFIDNNNYELTTSISLNDSKLIKEGNYVRMESSDYKNTIIGEVRRIGKHINPLTQSIDVIISLNDKLMKDGAFISGQIICDTLHEVHKIHRTRLINKNSIYILKKDTVSTLYVEPLYSENDSVIIKKLIEETCIVTQYRNDFYNGMSIK